MLDTRLFPTITEYYDDTKEVDVHPALMSSIGRLIRRVRYGGQKAKSARKRLRLIALEIQVAQEGI